MKRLSIPALALVSALAFVPLPAMAACDHGGLCDDAHGHVDAPAPLIGASLPGLAVGFGVFWLIRNRGRRRKVD
jgi:hypothetical protein